MGGKSRTRASTIDLDSLAAGFPHIPQVCGQMMAQACAVCLDHHAHKCGVTLTVEAEVAEVGKLLWSEPVTDAMRRFWNDLDVATEHGAYGVAILLVRRITGYTIVERARKGTGFDWWLGHEDDLFQKKARLEVSGILRGDSAQIARRVALKKKQTRQSDSTDLPAYVVVVEFSTPRSKFVKR